MWSWIRWVSSWKSTKKASHIVKVLIVIGFSFRYSILSWYKQLCSVFCHTYQNHPSLTNHISKPLLLYFSNSYTSVPVQHLFSINNYFFWSFDVSTNFWYLLVSSCRLWNTVSLLLCTFKFLFVSSQIKKSILFSLPRTWPNFSTSIFQ